MLPKIVLKKKTRKKINVAVASVFLFVSLVQAPFAVAEAVNNPYAGTVRGGNRQSGGKYANPNAGQAQQEEPYRAPASNNSEEDGSGNAQQPIQHSVNTLDDSSSKGDNEGAIVETDAPSAEEDERQPQDVGVIAEAADDYCLNCKDKIDSRQWVSGITVPTWYGKDAVPLAAACFEACKSADELNGGGQLRQLDFTSKYKYQELNPTKNLNEKKDSFDHAKDFLSEHPVLGGAAIFGATVGAAGGLYTVYRGAKSRIARSAIDFTMGNTKAGKWLLSKLEGDEYLEAIAGITKATKGRVLDETTASDAVNETLKYLNKLQGTENRRRAVVEGVSGEADYLFDNLLAYKYALSKKNVSLTPSNRIVSFLGNSTGTKVAFAGTVGAAFAGSSISEAAALMEDESDYQSAVQEAYSDEIKGAAIGAVSMYAEDQVFGAVVSGVKSVAATAANAIGAAGAAVLSLPVAAAASGISNYLEYSSAMEAGAEERKKYYADKIADAFDSGILD